jgi:regulator of replication initiation timing
MKKELQSLVEELTTLSIRNDDLIAARERDAQAMNEMEARVEEYRRKYDAVRIELRNLKGS